MKRAAVAFTCFDDIKTVYGFIRSAEPLAIAFPPACLPMLSDLEAVSISFIGSSGEKFDAELLNIEENVAFFKLIGEGRKEDGKFGLTVDYKSEFTAACVPNEKLSIYLSYCKDINAAMRNKLSIRLKEAVKGEDSDNFEVFSFLFEMNAKIDEILSILRPPLEIDGGFEARGVALSSSSFSFFSSKDLSGVDRIFARLLLAESGDRFHFASIGELSTIKQNPDGSGIYKMIFSNVETDIKDAVVRFLFAREREILKEARL